MRKFAVRMIGQKRELGASLAIAAIALSLLAYLPSEANAANCGWDTGSGWVARENAKKGAPNWAANIPIEYAGDFARRDQSAGFDKWIESGVSGKRVEGWFDSPSVTCGQSVGLHLSGNADPIKISIFRIGYYGGANARLISEFETKKAIPANQAPEISAAPRSTITTNWPIAYQFEVNKDTPPGQYLFRLDDGNYKSTFVPLMITNPDNKYSLTFVSAVMTWQAYNQWGGYSLYKGPNSRRASRATVVSFRRPYDGDGSGQTRYMEAPLLRVAESLGIDINYATDFELDQNSPMIKSATTILLGGHDEYWTNNMRDNLQAAVNRGSNLIVLGGNTGYNRIRLEDDQRLAMWRRTKGDPFATVPDKATLPWRLSPISKPESLLLGSQYIGLGVSGSYKVTHPDRWPFNAMRRPDVLDLVVGREVDSPLYSPGPAVETLATSEITMRGQKAVAMATYYTSKSGAGVLNIGTNGWICSMAAICPWHNAVPESVRTDVRLVTESILQEAVKGPLARSHPMVIDLKIRFKNTKFSENA